MKHSRNAVFAVIFLVVVLLILFLSIRPSFAFFLTGSITAALIFVTILFWLLVEHGSLVLPESFNTGSRLQYIAISSATLLLTAALLGLVTLLCVRVKNPSIIFYVCVGIDLLLVHVIFLPFVARKVVELCRRRPAMRRLALSMSRLLLSDEEEDGSADLEFSYLKRLGGLPKKFSFEELKAATNNFQNPIGRGGSGSVFKGVLFDGLPVAVKRIEGELHGEREFRSEITAIVSAQHVNLVAILGYCLVPGGHRFLVYEFIQNGSLDSWIFTREGVQRFCLTWAMRYQVAIDVAKALAYLHHDCRFRILHLDVKPQNILLDENFRARVSDFGISRMMDRDESRVVTTIRGTRGYLAPEWFSRAGISEKSDVYSYGMVLLELLGGRKNCEYFDDGNISQRTWIYFPKIVSEKMREGKLMEVVDERLIEEGGVEESEVRVLVYVALWCIQERAELRPSMEMVVSMLRGHVPVDMPPETRMFMVDLIMPIDSSTGSGLSSASAVHTDDPSTFAHSISISTRLLR